MSSAAIPEPLIDPAEQARRAKAVKQAAASARLEGGTTSPERSLLTHRFVSGEIDLDTFVSLGHSLAQQAAHKATPPVVASVSRIR